MARPATPTPESSKTAMGPDEQAREATRDASAWHREGFATGRAFSAATSAARHGARLVADEVMRLTQGDDSTQLTSAMTSRSRFACFTDVVSTEA